MPIREIFKFGALRAIPWLVRGFKTYFAVTRVAETSRLLLSPVMLVVVVVPEASFHAIFGASLKAACSAVTIVSLTFAVRFVLVVPVAVSEILLVLVFRSVTLVLVLVPMSAQFLVTN
jgi:hypothetical protein